MFQIEMNNCKNIFVSIRSEYLMSYNCVQIICIREEHLIPYNRVQIICIR